MSELEVSTGDARKGSDRAVTWAALPDLLEAERLLRQHEEPIARTRLPTLRALSPCDTEAMRADHNHECRTALVRMLIAAPTLPTLRMVGEALDKALSAKPDEDVVEACLAILIDTRVKLPHNLPAYLEALIFDLQDEGFPPAVVAAACQRIRRESVFLPEISEVLATCRETLARYQSQRRRVEGAIKARQDAELWLAQLPHEGSCPSGRDDGNGASES